MVKIVSAAIVAVAFASDDLLSDDALSLLQTRAQKHVASEPMTLADGSELIVQPGGTLCADDEVITFAKCVEAQKRQVVPNGMAHGTVYNKRNLWGNGLSPTGCFKFGNSLVFNDQPFPNANPGAFPICQVGGGGGRAEEIATQGMSCQEPTCIQPRGNHLMTWDDSVFIPELYLGDFGTVCDDACGLLTYEQCSKAGDMGLVEALGVGPIKLQAQHQSFGASHTSGTMPSACSVQPGMPRSSLYFNSMDTPSGIFAAPDTDGEPWVTESGVGSGWSNNNRPICGVCTTTTTTAATEENDDAAAEGDPHMTTMTGKKFDLQ